MYRIRVYLGTDENGKKLFKRETFRPKAQSGRALQKELEDEAQRLTTLYKGYMPGQSVTYAEAVKAWREACTITEGQKELYEGILRLHVLPRIGDRPIDELKRRDFQRVIDCRVKEGAKPKTVRRTYTAMNSVMKAAEELHLVPENLCKGVKLPPQKAQEREHIFSFEEAARFLSVLKTEIPKTTTTGKRTGTVYINQMFIAFFYLLLYSGMRRGEAGALDWSDVDFETGTVTISKALSTAKGKQYVKKPKTTAGIRKIAVAAPALEELRKWKEEQEGKIKSPHVFIQDNGEYMNLSTPTHKVREIIKYYNRNCESQEERLPNIHLHDLRHTHASLLIAGGADIATVSRRLGHAAVSVTLDVYSHALPANDKTAADMISERLKIENSKTPKVAQKLPNGFRRQKGQQGKA